MGDESDEAIEIITNRKLGRSSNATVGFSLILSHSLIKVQLTFDRDPDAGRLRYSRKLRQWEAEGKIKDLKGALHHLCFKVIQNMPVPGSDLAAQIATQLHTKATEKELSEVNRLDKALDLLEGDTCIAWRMAEYFGDGEAVPDKRCGNCEICVNGPIDTSTTARCPPMEREKFEECCQACPFRGDPNLLARFCYGVVSYSIFFKDFLLMTKQNWPKLTKAKLTKACEQFGLLEGCSWTELLEACTEVCQQASFTDVGRPIKQESSAASVKRSSQSVTSRSPRKRVKVEWLSEAL